MFSKRFQTRFNIHITKYFKNISIIIYYNTFFGITNIIIIGTTYDNFLKKIKMFYVFHK